MPTGQLLEIDDLHLDKDCLRKQTSSSEFPGNKLQPVVVAHDIGKEGM